MRRYGGTGKTVGIHQPSMAHPFLSENSRLNYHPNRFRVLMIRNTKKCRFLMIGATAKAYFSKFSLYLSKFGKNQFG
jgi:hypothetical protein